MPERLLVEGRIVGLGKLSRRLFLLTLIALIPAAAVLFYNLNYIRADREAEVRDEALRAGQLTALEVQRIVSGAENVLIALAAAPVIQGVDAAGCNVYLSRAGRQLPQFDAISVVNMQGTITCGQDNGAIGVSLAERAPVKEAISTGKFTIGNYSVDKVGNNPTLPLALPMKDDSGTTIGVMVGALDIDWLGQRLRERDFAKDSTVTVADRNGVILALEPTAKGFVGTPFRPAYLHLVRERQAGVAEVVSRDGVARIVGYYPPAVNAYELFVAAGISANDAYNSINRATWIGLIVTLASLALSFVLAGFSSRQLIQRPIERLTGTIKAWRAGDEAVRTGMDGDTNELGIVGNAIDDFLVELAKARQATAKLEAQRELLMRELDHRIKNLLATVQSMARQAFRDTDRIEDAVNVFIKRLAAMSDAHGLLMRDDWQSAQMKDVIAATVKPFAGEHSGQFRIEGPDFPAKAKAVLAFSMALHELCTNALKYGALSTAEGRIHIEWSTGHAPAGDVFRLSWTERGGPAVSAPSRFGFGSKMIERFLSYELEADVVTDYAASGLTFTLAAPLERIRRADIVAQDV